MRHGSPSPAHLVEMSPTVIYSARASGDFGATYVSPNVTRQMGYVPEDFTEDSGFWAKGLHPDDRERVLAGMSALPETNHCSLEYRFLHADETYRWMHDDLRLVRNAAGDPLEVVGYWDRHHPSARRRRRRCGRARGASARSYGRLRTPLLEPMRMEKLLFSTPPPRQHSDIGPTTFWASHSGT